MRKFSRNQVCIERKHTAAACSFGSFQQWRFRVVEKYVNTHRRCDDLLPRGWAPRPAVLLSCSVLQYNKLNDKTRPLGGQVSGLGTYEQTSVVNVRGLVPQVRMSLNGSAHEGHDTSDVERLRHEVQLLRERQASMIEDIRKMSVEFKRDNGRLDSGGAEGSAAARERSAGPRPTAVRQRPAVAGPAAVRGTILGDGGLRNFGETGQAEAAFPVEIGPERDEPDQLGRSGERVYTLAVTLAVS